VCDFSPTKKTEVPREKSDTMMTATDESELSLSRRSKFEQTMVKTKEWVVDRGNVVLGQIAGDRSKAIFYISLVLLCGLIVTIFVVDKEEVEDLVLPTDEGGLMATHIEDKIPAEDLLQPVPTGVNIVIIGDSISRYGYLSLVYFLRWGRWFEPTLEKSNLVNEGSFKSMFHNDNFGEFYFQTSRMIQPHELCDCYKETKNASESHIENRYYHDPEMNNTITFLHAYGHQHAIHGRINANEAHNISKWDWHREEKHLVRHEKSDLEWDYDNWADVVEKYIGNLEPKPEFVIANAGQWSNNFGPNGKRVSEQFSGALKNLGIRKSIWKTTTFAKGGELLQQDVPETDSYMCSLLQDCFDVSWTKNVAERLYWDKRHFFEPVYRAMNEEMLQLMGYLPRGYAKIGKDKLLKGYGDDASDAYPIEEKGDDED
jgi:hypothetical protein